MQPEAVGQMTIEQEFEVKYCCNMPECAVRQTIDRLLAEIQRLRQPIQPSSEDVQFLLTCLREHRASHYSWVAPLRAGLGLTADGVSAVGDAEYQQALVDRYSRLISIVEALAQGAITA